MVAQFEGVPLRCKQPCRQPAVKPLLAQGVEHNSTDHSEQVENKKANQHIKDQRTPEALFSPRSSWLLQSGQLIGGCSRCLLKRFSCHTIKPPFLRCWPNCE